LAICLAGLILLVSSLARGGSLLGNRAEYTIQLNPSGIVASDFDGDGDCDLAVNNRGDAPGSGDSVTILLNNGDGLFMETGRYFANYTPTDLALIDIDRDGDDDLVSANRGSVTATLIYNNGDGSFQNGISYLADSNPTGVTVADFNHDGFPDLAVSNMAGQDVSILLNKGDGTFNVRVNYMLSSACHDVDVADFDGDGDTDVAVAHDNGAAVLINDGRGVFSPVALCSGYWLSVNCRDYNGDGRYDLALGGFSTIAVWLGLGDASFYDAGYFSTGGSVERLASADLDLDGTIDILAPCGWSGALEVHLNNGSGQFAHEGSYPAGDYVSDACTGDFDGDGDLDVAVSSTISDLVTVYFNQAYIGKCALDFDTVQALEAYFQNPRYVSVYVGAFDSGHTIDDIDPFSITINDVVPPYSFYGSESHPDIPGEVVRITFDIRDFADSYGLLWDTIPRIFNVSGQFTDETPFAAGGNVVVVGFRPGDANLDDRIDIGDPVLLISYLYRLGAAPQLDATADANGDGAVNLADAQFLVNYIFKDGPAPVPDLPD
jgi:hypothetical protein